MSQFDLHDWNRRLVDAIFHDRVDASPYIRRIDATDSFLAEAGGFEDGARARESFLGAMPHTEIEVRRLFDYTFLDSWKPAYDVLPFYAQLHLTILAASADESLQDEGNFRVRLAQMLGIEPKDYISGGCLPFLWKQAQRWSVNRAERRGDTRQLLLPDPGNETIIGYSKRLAFPGFRDQNRLAELFTRAGIDASASLLRLLELLRTNQSRFSDRFQDEFNRFAKLVEVGDRDGAVETIFWDAVADTTWTRRQYAENGSSSGCRLEIDPTNPYDLGMWLYCQVDDDGGSGWEQISQDMLPNGMICWQTISNDSPGKVLDMLRARWKKSQYLSWLGGCLGRALNDGCIGFMQDSEGRWFNIPAAPNNGYLWLVLHQYNSWLSDFPNAATIYRAPLAGSSSWTLLGPINVDDNLRNWLATRPDIPEFFYERLIRRNISVVGSVRRSDGAYLFLPPIVPSFRCKNAHSGTADVESNGHRQSYELCLEGDLLVLPENACNEINHDFFMHVVAFDESGKDLARSRIHFRNVSSALSFKVARNPSSWLENGLDHRLKVFVPAHFSEELDIAENRLPTGARMRPVTRSGPALESPFTVELEDEDPQWVRATEILSAMLACRYAIPLRECVDILSAIWGSRHEGWIKLYDMLDNGVLRMLYARRWSGKVVVASHPIFIAHACPDGYVVRIMGLLSLAMRALVNQALDGKCRVVVSPNKGTSGALECRVTNFESISALQAETNWPLLHGDTLPEIRLPMFEELFLESARENLKGYDEDEKAIWSSRLGKFMHEQIDMSDLPRLERWHTLRQQDLYVLYRKNGTTWNTDSRIWALLVLAAECGTSVGRVLDDGSVSLNETSLALPVPLAWRTVVAGGGVCFREPDGKRVYPAGTWWSPADALSLWVDGFSRKHERLRYRSAACERYRFLLEMQRRQH